MASTNRPAAPRGLGRKARKLWADTTDDYALSAYELRILEDACREVDLIERMEEALNPAKPPADPDALESTHLIVEGSQGQPVANPLIQELRQHRSTLLRLLHGLKLPGDEEAGAAARSTSARAAANARWKRGA